ncbi:MAG: N-acetyltransferase family protein [Candidatus Limnocylindria bacterium]
MGAVLRRGTPDDTRACHDLLWEAVLDLGQRRGTPVPVSADEAWRSFQALYQRLAEHAAEWWVAQERDTRELIGFARSVERGGLFELTEFFVRPGLQSGGVGRTLLERAFPLRRGEVRVIIATTDVRALALYYGSDTVARFPILTMGGAPARTDPGDLRSTEIAGDAAHISAIGNIERAVIGFERGEDEIQWLLSGREGHLYLRDGAAIGFAFVGRAGAGPVAALDPNDLPQILLHVESRAASMGLDRLELEVPAPNSVAVRHLLGRRFRIDPWVNVLMSSSPFGRFDRFIAFSPPIIL